KEATDRRRADEAMEARLEAIRLDRSETWDSGPTDLAYEAAFRDHGLDVLGTEDVETLAARVKASPIALSLVVALEHWRTNRVALGRKSPRLAALVEAADPDPWRARLRAARAPGDLVALAEAADIAAMPIPSLLDLVDRLGHAGDPNRAADLARSIDVARPGDFWVNLVAGYWHQFASPPRADDAVRYYTAALALRPASSAWLGHNLADALALRGDHAEAIAASREALRTRPDLAASHRRLGLVLRGAGDPDAAAAEFREAIRLDPENALAHDFLGLALRDKGDFDGAIAEHREAIRLAPGVADHHIHLGGSLRMSGDIDGAIAEHREALRLRPGYALARTSLGTALRAKGDVEGTVAEFREAIRNDPKLMLAHLNLGRALKSLGDIEGAIAALREAARLAPGDPQPIRSLRETLYGTGDARGAIAAVRQAVRLRPRSADLHAELGVVLRESGYLEDALAAHREAVRLAPGSAEFQHQLGVVLAYLGSFEEAAMHTREALRLAPGHAGALASLGWLLRGSCAFEEAAQRFREAAARTSDPPQRAHLSHLAEETDALAALDPRLAGVLSGTDRPADAAEEATFALLASRRGYQAASVRLYARALAAGATVSRYNAACAAALGGSGMGAETLDDAERSRLRGLAIEWLRAELAAEGDRLKEGSEAARRGVRQNLFYWLLDSELAGIRDEARLARLPAGERRMCRALWRDVDAILSRAGATR
ncbi:MAG: tetratricopeptide repeat protein, partial [Planctomycetes bacterium]|nr:tetratricopeptide repeat protein [Planctomycetota bacterium]